MTRTAFDAGFCAVCCIVGIPPAVCLAMDDPGGVLLAAGVVAVLMFLTSPGPASAPNGPRSRASREKSGTDRRVHNMGVNSMGRVTRSCSNDGR